LSELVRLAGIEGELMLGELADAQVARVDFRQQAGETVQIGGRGEGQMSMSLVKRWTP